MLVRKFPGSVVKANGFSRIFDKMTIYSTIKFFRTEITCPRFNMGTCFSWKINTAYLYPLDLLSRWNTRPDWLHGYLSYSPFGFWFYLSIFFSCDTWVIWSCIAMSGMNALTWQWETRHLIVMYHWLKSMTATDVTLRSRLTWRDQPHLTQTWWGRLYVAHDSFDLKAICMKHTYLTDSRFEQKRVIFVAAYSKHSSRNGRYNGDYYDGEHQAHLFI